MRKQSKKQDMKAAALFFLVGLILLAYPVVSQVLGYRADDDAYAELAQQVMQPEQPEPQSELEPPNQTGTAEPATTPLHTEKVAAVQVVNTPKTVYTESTKPEIDVQPTETLPLVSPAPPAVLKDIPETETLTGSAPMASPMPTNVSTAFPDVTASSAPTAAPPVPTASPVASGQSGKNLEQCLAQNEEFVAWLTIPGTPIDYPVVRSDRTEYYLHHLFNGKESKLGCLFSLKSADYQAPSRNIAIYGHHLSGSDAMFSTLMDYKSASYCASHSTIHLDSLYGERTYRIFAVFNMNVSDWDAAVASFSGNEDFERFVNRAVGLSLYDTGVQVMAEDNILTLITCDRSYGGASGRLIVMAVEE